MLETEAQGIKLGCRDYRKTAACWRQRLPGNQIGVLGLWEDRSMLEIEAQGIKLGFMVYWKTAAC